jgi:membrane protein DedA with SNARE-associated domain
MFIAGGAALKPNADFTSVLIIAITVALGAPIAKGIHYGVILFTRERLNGKRHTALKSNRLLPLKKLFAKFLSEKNRTTLETNTAKIKKRAFLSLYLTAATPIPDEPIVFTLGLMKYSITKFFTAFFLGKLSITVMGAFTGSKMGNVLSEWLSPEMMDIVSIVLTIALTVIIAVILFKCDLGKFTRYFTGKKQKSNCDEEILGKN